MPPTHHISNANRHWPSKGSALKPNGRKRIADQTEMLLFIAGKKTKEAAAKLCARSRWLTFSQKNETKVTAGGSSSSSSTGLGSKADIGVGPRHVRFTPKSGHWNSVAKCLLCAKSRHSAFYVSDGSIGGGFRAPVRQAEPSSHENEVGQ